MAPKVLVVLTSADTNTINGAKTGWYLPEFAHPYEVLSSKGVDMTVASPKGGATPIDPSSIDAFKDDPVCSSFLSSKQSIYNSTTPLKDFLGRAGEFDAVLYPGGHGPLFDLATDDASARLIAEFWDAGKIVGAICHGPAVFRAVKVQGGQPLVKGKTITGFTDEEEELVGLTDAVPFLLEKELKAQGATFEKADKPWGSKVVVDGKLITGQNPASGKDFGEAVAKALGV
ncbi:hypothetical protein S7711_05004 [Stachybotrys chartarum IBT 7711]|uniref:D-lactate dehydratase n=1 Tax=Stachybotrys chartarum (strain CBS 109288 / IBT 7711) TaxID=1280523 RepID=A0A084ARD7_STACB|nr:hypothetical protein S7711_05004 [Stachybotrys chartarum IBT 7711]KFA47880.1 hypothetical protein S40293_05174 [Stachybotrys chartarum IBT 40293]KFA79896.1 hypothetical protein S40288_03753 [Stachybotrys chartarum IBT 40288]